MDICQRVRDAREALGLTRADTARRAGLDHAHLSRFESGERNMSAERLARLFDVLGLDVLPADQHGGLPDTETVADDAVTVQPAAVT